MKPSVEISDRRRAAVGRMIPRRAKGADSARKSRHHSRTVRVNQAGQQAHRQATAATAFRASLTSSRQKTPTGHLICQTLPDVEHSACGGHNPWPQAPRASRRLSSYRGARQPQHPHGSPRKASSVARPWLERRHPSIHPRELTPSRLASPDKRRQVSASTVVHKQVQVPSVLSVPENRS